MRDTKNIILRSAVLMATFLALIMWLNACKTAPKERQEGATAIVQLAPAQDKQEPALEPLPPQGESKPGKACKLHPVHFAFDRADILDRDLAAQDAECLRSNPPAVLIITGHCDERGTEEYNLALGQQRANAAKQYMQRSGYGGKVKAVSAGKNLPACNESNEDCWARNRRAEMEPK